eukprot:742433-Pleurochrysis_carterae.AAC.1
MNCASFKFAARRRDSTIWPARPAKWQQAQNPKHSNARTMSANADTRKNTMDWDILTSKTPAPDEYLAAQLASDLAEDVFQNPEIKTQLIKYLLTPCGVVTVGDLKQVMNSVVVDCLGKAGLLPSFSKTLVRYIFPCNITTFPHNETFGVGKDQAAAVEKSGEAKGWLNIKFSHPYWTKKLATEQVGGVGAMANHFQFTDDLAKELKRSLYLEDKRRAETMVAHVIFMFWLLAFGSAYLCAPGKARLAVLLHRLNKSLKT